MTTVLIAFHCAQEFKELALTRDVQAAFLGDAQVYKRSPMLAGILCWRHGFTPHWIRTAAECLFIRPRGERVRASARKRESFSAYFAETDYNSD